MNYELNYLKLHYFIYNANKAIRKIYLQKISIFQLQIETYFLILKSKLNRFNQ